jgi:sugar lactone lactonase YvrE
MNHGKAASFLAFILLSATLFSCDGGGSGTLIIVKDGSEPSTAAAGQPVNISVKATEGGTAKSGVEVAFKVDLGGGSVSLTSVKTGTDGKAAVAWTIGLSPVKNSVTASLTGADAGTPVVFETTATLDKPLSPEWFANVDKFMTDNSLAGSTEDLAFSLDGKKVYLGIPGGLLTVDAAGVVTKVALTGEKLGSPLGIDFDKDGNLWVADQGAGSVAGALRMVTPAGAVSTILTEDGSGTKLGKPNFVMAGADGKIYFSDTCIAKLLRYDPVLKMVDASITVDYKTEGGPNGIAIDSTGKKLYFTTENTAVLCGHTDVQMDTKNSALFVADITQTGFANNTAVKKNFAHFGDGCTFDAEGNLYVIFDNIDFNNLKLKESTVYVMPAGLTEFRKFLTTTDRIMANLEFGRGDFGANSLYISLLSITGFISPEMRGLNKFSVGIMGGGR